MSTPDLKPRAIAALCCLRGAPAPRSLTALRSAIGDENIASTRDLMADIRRDTGYIALVGTSGWCLTYEGIGWCETQGLPVSDDAKSAAAALWESERTPGGAR